MILAMKNARALAHLVGFPILMVLVLSGFVGLAVVLLAFLGVISIARREPNDIL